MIIDSRRQALIDVFLEQNKQVNLSAIRDPQWVYIKHIVDSLELLKIVDLQERQDQYHGALRVGDVGTGGGFPLLPLAMTYPSIQFVWIDSVHKKLQAISHITGALHMENVTLLWSRAEDVRQSFDVLTARAVAYIDKLLPWVQNLLKPWAKLILYKKAEVNPDRRDVNLNSDRSERELMIQLLPRFGLTLEREHVYQLFEGDIWRAIYVLSKQKRY